MRDGREYEREGGQRRVPRRMRERGASKKRREIYLVIACLLLVVNVLLLLRMQSQIKGLNKALSQVMNRLSVQEDAGTPEARTQENVPNQGYFSAGEPAAEPLGEQIVDYVSLCGLPQVDKPVKRNQRQVLQRLEELAQDSEIIDEIYQDHTSYSDEMLKALANNPEMADFVRNSLDADTKGTGAGLSTLEKGQEHPLFLQWDPRWGYVEYGDSNIGLAGCGPTCVSMALYYLLGDDSITPEKIAAYSTGNGHYVMGTGTAWALLEDAPAEYGISVSQPRASEETMKDALDQGDVIICSMKAGDFTDGGHFVVVYGYDSKGFMINDSNCVARSREKWTYDRIGRQIKHLWIYSTNPAPKYSSGAGKTGGDGTGTVEAAGTDPTAADQGGMDPAEPADWAGGDPGGTSQAEGNPPGTDSSGSGSSGGNSEGAVPPGGDLAGMNPSEIGSIGSDSGGTDSPGGDLPGGGSSGGDAMDPGASGSNPTEPGGSDAGSVGTDSPGGDLSGAGSANPPGTDISGLDSSGQIQ